MSAVAIEAENYNELLYNERYTTSDYNVDKSRIFDILRNLDNTKSHGIDNLPPVLFAKISEVLWNSLYTLFYKIKQTCFFPRYWKRPSLFLRTKRNLKLMLPVTGKFFIHSILSKVFERCFFIDLYEHLSPWLHSSQFCFRTGINKGITT